MVTYEWKIPKIPLFNVGASKRLFVKETHKTINNILMATQRNIKEGAPVGTTGALRDGVKTELFKDSGRVFTSEQGGYAVVIEKGRKKGARRPPVDPLKRWLRLSSKGRSLFAKMKESYPRLTYKAAAFILARSISRKGTRRNPFFDRGVRRSRSKTKKEVMLLSRRIAVGLMTRGKV